MSTKQFRILASLSCILSVVMLIVSFVINPGPPPHATAAQLIAFGTQYHNAILLGAWLQAISAPLIILFAIALVFLAGATMRFSGWATLFGGLILVMVSLIEVVFYIGALGNPALTGPVSFDLIHVVQHLYSMIAAPIIFLPLAAVLLGSQVLPRVFGYAALVLGVAFAILGGVVLFAPIQDIVNFLAFTQGLWWLFAAIVLLVRPGKVAEVASTAI